jgi:cell division protein FtsL
MNEQILPLLVVRDEVYYLSHQGTAPYQTTNERVYIMKSIKTFVAVIALATSFGSFAAQTVTATASTIDGAEAKIAAQAQEAGASSYKITQAFSGNRVHMTAELNK